MIFDIKNITSIEFSIKTEHRNDDGKIVEEFYRISTDRQVKIMLKECLETTLKAFPSPIEGIDEFEISEKYSEKDRFKTHLISHLRAKEIFEEDPSGNIFMSHIPKESIQYYRVDYTDSNGHRISGIRRASYFKSLLKNRNRLVRFYDDSLCAVKDEFFKLDNDFDFISHGEIVYVLRPRVFESMVLPDDEVTNSALAKLYLLEDSLGYVNFESIKNAVNSYKRAARLVFAVSQRTDIDSIDKEKVVYYAGSSNVGIDVDESGVITPKDGQEIDFLEMLDRRIYNVEFIEGETESYRAYSRKRR
ncbi:DUF4868 domain-containing protein [Halomonas sp. ATBC28]|uniref:Kiwa anti-phage protein KwaB-like domain-containing protein n=1 Tax=Halomonas sp. ATBC28 TaxID=2545264 RepID=UPI00110F180A|nr:Kiwa anti-phage protein KwaB-like domain-containing protein [Halomonas sp. ATBC28]TMU20392.1 DUF4868 domain-containing protein [Halomonas sp. ATBC28]